MNELIKKYTDLGVNLDQISVTKNPILTWCVIEDNIVKEKIIIVDTYYGALDVEKINKSAGIIVIEKNRSNYYRFAYKPIDKFYLRKKKLERIFSIWK